MYKFSNETIVYVARMLQEAILTGTDIVDHLRMFECVVDSNNELVPSDEYKEMIVLNEKKMLEQLEQWKASKEAEQDTNGQ